MPKRFAIAMLTLWAFTLPCHAQDKDAGKPISATIKLPGDVALEMVEVPPGTFNMGSNDDFYVKGLESPVHAVNIAHAFQLGKFEVTQKQWFAVMDGFPQKQPSDNPDLPVVFVSWDDCQDFIKKLNGLGLGAFRLPSESEWEYACHAGTTTRWPHGDEEPGLEKYGWYKANSGGAPHAVGQKLPNAFGLYDMQGNVWEWTQDTFHGGGYTGAPADGSAWEDPAGTQRSIRGGAFGFGPLY